MTLALALTLTLASSALLAARFSRGCRGTFLVGSYVVWVTQIVVLSLTLSMIHRLGTTGYVVGSALVLGLAVALHARKPGAVPALGSLPRELLIALRGDRLVAVLASVVAVELAYVLVVALFTPPVDDDSLQYHLGRSALWLQHGGVTTFDPLYDFRLNAFPINGELVYAFFLDLGGGDRFVALTNVLAGVATTGAVVVGAGRLGLTLREALFGGLIAASYPIVALQAPSTLTDLQVAALVTSAVALTLRPARGDLALGALSLALAAGTKVTGLFAIPVVWAVTLATWKRHRVRASFAIVAGACAGGYWYLANAARVGSLLGETTADTRGSNNPLDVAARILRVVVDSLDLPGGVGRDRLLYPIAGVLLLTVAWSGGLRGRRLRDAALAATLVAVVPLILPFGALAQRSYEKLFIEAGRLDLASLDSDRVETVASSMQSGAGPVGVLLFVAATVFVAAAASRREVRRVSLLLAVSPLVWMIMVGAAAAYFRWNGRFTLPGFTLAAMCWGIVLRRRWLAQATVGAAAVTLVLAFVHFEEKPSGLRFLEPRSERSAFRTPLAEATAWDPRIVPLLRYLENDLPADARVASYPAFFPRRREIETVPELLTFTVFGRTLGRRVEFAIDSATASATGSDWYLSPTDRLERCVAGWRIVAERSGWSILRRAPSRTCVS